MLIVLLLSLLAAAPSWAGTPANVDQVVSEADASCNSGARDDSKRAKPTTPQPLLGTNPNIVTRSLYFRPAQPRGASFSERPAVALAFAYNARAPPAL